MTLNDSRSLVRCKRMKLRATMKHVRNAISRRRPGARASPLPKKSKKKASMLYEGADVLLRNGKTLTIRVRTLDNDSSDSYRRGIFTCEIVEKGESWSVVRIEPAG